MLNNFILRKTKSNSIVPYFIKEIYNETPLKVWVILSFVIGVVLMISRIEFKSESINILYIMNYPIPFYGDGLIWLNYYFFAITFLGILSFPHHFIDTINTRRISLILSKNFSRNDFIIQELVSGLIIFFIYSIISYLFISLALVIKLSVFPIFLIFYFILFSIILLFVFLFTLLIAILTKSFGLNVLLSTIYIFFISFFLANKNAILNLSQTQSSVIKIITDIVYYVTPRFYDLFSLLNKINQFSLKDFGNFIGIIFSFIPLVLMIFYLFNKKNFY